MRKYDSRWRVDNPQLKTGQLTRRTRRVGVPKRSNDLWSTTRLRQTEIGIRAFQGNRYDDALRQRRCISPAVRQFHRSRVRFCDRALRLADLVGSDARVPAVPASAAGALLGAAINYTLNYHVTFRSSKRHREAAVKFGVIAVAGLLLNTVFMWVGIKLIGAHYLLSQIVTTGLVLMWSFAGNRYWTFHSAAPGG